MIVLNGAGKTFSDESRRFHAQHDQKSHGGGGGMGGGKIDTDAAKPVRPGQHRKPTKSEMDAAYSAGLSKQGFLEKHPTGAKIEERLGPPTSLGGDKSTAQWELQLSSGTAVIADHHSTYKPSSYKGVEEWSILASSGNASAVVADVNSLVNYGSY